MKAFNDLGAAIFEAIVQISWQATVLVGLILLAQGLFRKRLSPPWRYGLWLLLVIRLLMPVSPQSAFSIFNVAKLSPPSSPAESHQLSTLPSGHVSEIEIPATVALLVHAHFEQSMSPPVAQLDRDQTAASQIDPLTNLATGPPAPRNWLLITFGLWLLGVLAMGTRMAWTNHRFRSRIQSHVPSKNQRGLRLLDEARTALGVSQRFTLIETTCVATPAAYGLWNKRLLLPTGFLDRFSDEELRHVFLHEIAHLKQRDLEVNWLVAILQLLHWFNPMLWFAFRRMRADRELATDALALSHIHEKEATPYGETILKVLAGLARQPSTPGLVGIAENKMQITQRLRAIANHGNLKPWRWIAVLSAVTIATLALTDAQDPISNTPIAEAAPELPSLKLSGTVRDAATGKPNDFRIFWADGIDAFDPNSERFRRIQELTLIKRISLTDSPSE